MGAAAESTMRAEQVVPSEIVLGGPSEDDHA